MDETDPFHTSVEEVGIAVDLRADSSQALHSRLSHLLRVESALDARGCNCPIKDDPHACCSACKIRHSDPLEDMTALCAVGMEQERLLTEIAVARHGP